MSYISNKEKHNDYLWFIHYINIYMKISLEIRLCNKQNLHNGCSDIKLYYSLIYTKQLIKLDILVKL